MPGQVHTRRADELVVTSDTRQLVSARALPSAGLYNGTFLVGLEIGAHVLLPRAAAEEIAATHRGVTIVPDAEHGELPLYVNPVTSDRDRWRDDLAEESLA